LDRKGKKRAMAGPNRSKIEHWIETGEITPTVMLKFTKKIKARIPGGLFYLTDIPHTVLVDDKKEGLSDSDGGGERTED